jgi:serine protease
MPERSFRQLALSAIAALLTACGGGGGGGGGGTPDVPEPPTPTPETFTLSGTITASSSQAVDGDTNDPAAPAVPNDTVQTAQPIANPITLGGYVNQPRTGSPGRSFEAGDIDDYYRVSLLAGQTITMLVADFREADADLYLMDTGGNVLDFSIESGEIETIVVPEDGDYLVNANAYEGATNYILAIGAGNGADAGATPRSEIVPGEMVIKLRDEAAGGTTAGPVSRLLDPAPSIEQRAGGRGRPRLMSLRGEVFSAPGSEALSRGAWEKWRALDAPSLRAQWQTLMAIKSLRGDPEVEYVEPNYRVKAALVPDDAVFSLQWHYPLIDLPTAWDTTTGEASVVVAVVDTGILSRHPDLAGQLVPGYDFVRDTASAGDGGGIDPDPEDPGDRSDSAANTYHGTHVAGTVAAAGNNGIGVAGVAWSARIMPLRALGVSGSGTSYDVNQAMRYAAGLPNDSGTLPERPADIINLSLGGGGFSQADQDLISQVRAAGVMVVASAGNEASSLPAYPASYDGVISVSAVDAQQRITSYSNSGALVDIAAPGGDNSVDLNGDGYPDGVLSTGGTGAGPSIDFTYTFLNGTSMAAPHVAGVLALMKSVNPDLSPADIDALLARGDMTDDLGLPGRDDLYGFGLVNAQRSLLAAIEAGGSSPATDPRLVASASTLNFGTVNDSLVLELRNGGGGELRLDAVEASTPWLTATPLEVEGDGLGLYGIGVDRTGLDTGVYSGLVTAVSSANDVVVRVLMSVGGDAGVADVGRVYIILYDMESNEPFSQAAADSKSGRYDYRFDQVPRGRYEIVAGSDADNDLFICDSGEACGAWLTIDRPIQLQPESDLQDLDFPIEYQVRLPDTAALIDGIPAEPQPAKARGSARAIAK